MPLLRLRFVVTMWLARVCVNGFSFVSLKSSDVSAVSLSFVSSLSVAAISCSLIKSIGVESNSCACAKAARVNLFCRFGPGQASVPRATRMVAKHSTASVRAPPATYTT